MSRKPGQRNKLELVGEWSASDAIDDQRGTVHSLDGELRETYEAMLSGCALLIQRPEPSENAPDDERDKMGNAFVSIGLTTRVLARALLARALGRPPLYLGADDDATPSDADDPVDGRVLDRLARALLAPDPPLVAEPSRADHNAALDDAALVFREVGLESFDVWCELDAGPDDDADELFTYPMSPESAHVALIEFLFDRAEALVAEDPLLFIERDASSWEFSRWSVSPPPGRGSPDVANFARRVREQEYSLVDRATVTLGTSLFADLVTDETFADLFPRQYRMVQAFLASFVGVFECVAIDGPRVTLRSLRDGASYTVHEHRDVVEYSTGWIAVGRLLPFDGGVHLRSSGMVFARPHDPQIVTRALEALNEAGDTLPPAIALEGFLSSAMFGVDVPRAMKPARSRADARVAETQIRDVLADASLGPDATLRAFLVALENQANPGAPQGSPLPQGGRRTTKRGLHRRR